MTDFVWFEITAKAFASCGWKGLMPRELAERLADNGIGEISEYVLPEQAYISPFDNDEPDDGA